MPLRLTFGYDKEDLLQAQWNLIRLLQSSLSSGYSYSYLQAHQQLSELVNNLGKPESPPAWVAAFGTALLRSITALNEARCKETETALRRITDERDWLQRTLTDIQQDPLQDQVQSLTEDRDRWLDQAAVNGRRIDELETALQRAQTARQTAVTHLQTHIAQQNHLLVQQEEELQEYRS